MWNLKFKFLIFFSFPTIFSATKQNTHKLFYFIFYQNKIIQRLTEIKMRYFLKIFRWDKSWDSDSDLGLNRINNWKCLSVIFFFFQMIYLYETMKTDLRLVEKKIILLYFFLKFILFLWWLNMWRDISSSDDLYWFPLHTFETCISVSEPRR